MFLTSLHPGRVETQPRKYCFPHFRDGKVRHKTARALMHLFVSNCYWNSLHIWALYKVTLGTMGCYCLFSDPHSFLFYEPIGKDAGFKADQRSSNTLVHARAPFLLSAGLSTRNLSGYYVQDQGLLICYFLPCVRHLSPHPEHSKTARWIWLKTKIQL